MAIVALYQVFHLDIHLSEEHLFVREIFSGSTSPYQHQHPTLEG